MTKTIQRLAALLALQLMLALGLSFTGPSLSAKTTDTPLLAVAKEKIDHLTIEGPDHEKVVLAKSGDKWKLPDEGDFPADSAKVTQMLDRIEGVKLGIPVATSSGAQERFKVSDTVFERRVTFGSGDKPLAVLYLGTSPSMRQVHARRGDRNDVYAVELATYEVPVKAEDWEDKTVLQVSKDDIQDVEVDGLNIERNPASAIAAATQPTVPLPGNAKSDTKSDANKEPAWLVQGLQAGETLKVDAADKLVGLIAGLAIDSVLGKEEKPDYGLAQPVLKLAVVRKNKDRIEYLLGKMAGGQAYALKPSTRGEYFRLTSYAAQNLIDAAKREALVEQPAATPEKAKEPPAKLRKAPVKKSK